MGGEKETVVPGKAAAVVGGSPGTKLTSNVRVHQSGREVHFHDDVNKVKAAVPVALWSNAWDEIVTRDLKNWSYTDAVNQSLLTLEVQLNNNNLDINISLSKIVVGDTFKALDKFTKG